MASKLVSDILQSGKTDPVYQWRRGGITAGDTNYYLTVGDVDSCKTQAEFLKHVVMIFKSTRDVEITGKFDISGASFGSGAIDGDSITDGSITSEKFASYVVINGELNGIATRAMFDGDEATDTSNVAQAIHNKYVTKSWVQGNYTSTTDLNSIFLKKADATSTYALKTEVTTIQSDVEDLKTAIGKGTVTPSGNTTWTGTSTYSSTGKIILDTSAASSTIVGESTNINLQIKTKTGESGNAVTRNPFFTYPSATGEWGFGIQGGFGGIVVGAGECGKKIVSGIPLDGASENLFLGADTSIYFFSGFSNNPPTSLDDMVKLTNRTFTNINGLTATTLTATNVNVSAGILQAKNSSGSVTWKIANDGTVTGVNTLTASGLISAKEFNTTSDRNLKQDFEEIKNALQKVKALTGYTYVLKTDPTIRRAGLIAQDVREVLPEAVREQEESNGSYLTLNYSGVLALVVESIKEISERLEQIEARLN